MSDLDELTRGNVKLLREKERTVYWLCRTMVICQDEETRNGAMAWLEELGYDWQRVKRMIRMGEPWK